MAQDDLFGAPAGWYPDPLGLPQLRWWNNHAWTEQTSAARQPMVMQDTKFAWADDELPTRREERERERQRDVRTPATTAKPTAATLRELEPPRAFTKINDTPAPSELHEAVTPEPFNAQPLFATQAPAAAEPVYTQQAPAASAPSMESLFQQEPVVTPAAPTTQGAPSFGELFDSYSAPAAPAAAAPDESLDNLFGYKTAARPTARRSTPVSTADFASTGARTGNPVVSTGPAWIIAMIPLFQLVLSLLLLTALGMGDNVAVFVGILTVPYLIVVALAYFDNRKLKAAGIERPAHWAWAFATAPVYLLLRARAVILQSGHGIGPVLVWFGLGALHLASVVAIPGLIIAVLPGVFTTQLQSSVEADALLISGAEMSVTCPASPPVLFGEQVICKAVSSSGKNSDISVSLERANGWIEWQVIDWGVWGITK